MWGSDGVGPANNHELSKKKVPVMSENRFFYFYCGPNHGVHVVPLVAFFGVFVARFPKRHRWPYSMPPGPVPY